MRGAAEVVRLAVCVAVFTAATVVSTPPTQAQTCAPGFVANPYTCLLYTAQCLAPVSTATINGVPCVASNLGLCSSFVQNQQPIRRPAG